MQTYFRIVALIATLFMSVSVVSAHDWTKVRIGTEGAYPPFNNLEANGDLVGFDIDIANALCKEMNVECEFVIQDWDGMIPALLANKFDAVIASMSITEERKQKVDFSSKYYNTPPAIAVPKDSTLTEATKASLADIALGAQSSTTHSNYAEKYFEDSDIKLYPTPDEYKLDLANGRLDAAIDDIVVLGEWLATDDGACCKILTPLPTDPVINGEGAGVAVRKEDTELRDMFSSAITAIRNNGEYKKVNDEYFDFDVFGD